MKFVISKEIATDDVSVVAKYFREGFDVRPVDRRAKSGGTAVRRRRRTRAPLKVTPQIVKEMTDLRAQGKVWRVIGKRYGVSGTRAWQIVTSGSKS